LKNVYTKATVLNDVLKSNISMILGGDVTIK